MSFSFYLKEIISDEESEFILDFIREVLNSDGILWIFVTDDACYQLSELILKISKVFQTVETKQTQFRILINENVFESLGLLPSKLPGKKENNFFEYLDEESFYKKYLEISSELKDRHLKF